MNFVLLLSITPALLLAAFGLVMTVPFIILLIHREAEGPGANIACIGFMQGVLNVLTALAILAIAAIIWSA